MGALRRAKSNRHGQIAQIFGENGQDADFITALHLTRYLDAPVKVSVWMVKDSTGRLSNENGRQPLLTEFIGRIRRPTASDAGQTALFFGENGPNADAINRLNESKYLDALVLVELQKAVPGMMASEITTGVPTEELEAGKDRLTAEETQTLKKHQKRAEQIQQLLRQDGFFSKAPVLRALGTPDDYRAWLASQACCYPQPGMGGCQEGPVRFMDVVGTRLGDYNAIPMCGDHLQAWTDGIPDVGAQGQQAFLTSQAVLFVQRWAQDALRRKLNVPNGYLPSGQLIYAWAADHQLRGMLPTGFVPLMDPDN